MNRARRLAIFLAAAVVLVVGATASA